MTKIKFILLFIFLTTLTLSCKKEVKEEENVFYTCSMDPQVRERKPGYCPICKMALSKTIINKTDRNSNIIKLSDSQARLANIIVEEVKSSLIGEGISIRGTVVPDAGKITNISSRVKGRIEKLYFKNPGEIINKGDHIYDIYSEDLQTALKQYLALKEKVAKLKNTEVDYSEFLKSAKEKLLLLDISEKQLEGLSLENYSDHVSYYSKSSGVISSILVKEGDYIEEGSDIYSLTDLSQLWIEAEIYPHDEQYIRNNPEISISILSFPQDHIKGKIIFINPELENNSRINLVRIEISNKDKKYKPGMQAIINIESDKKRNIVIPSDAILHAKEGAMVWIKNNEGGYEPKIVTLGIQNNLDTEITSGLNEGDLVVISGVYLLNSEYTLKKGSTALENLTGSTKPGMENMTHHHH